MASRSSYILQLHRCFPVQPSPQPGRNTRLHYYDNYPPCKPWCLISIDAPLCWPRRGPTSCDSARTCSATPKNRIQIRRSTVQAEGGKQESRSKHKENPREERREGDRLF